MLKKRQHLCSFVSFLYSLPILSRYFNNGPHPDRIRPIVHPDVRFVMDGFPHYSQIESSHVCRWLVVGRNLFFRKAAELVRIPLKQQDRLYSTGLRCDLSIHQTAIDHGNQHVSKATFTTRYPQCQSSL